MNNQPQRVIVYQNRADAAMDEFFYQHPLAGLLIISVFVTVIVFFAYRKRRW